MDQKTNGLALASLILGIMGLIGMLPLLGSVLAVVFGHMARGQISQDASQTGEGLAMGGLITGYIGLAIQCLALVMALIWVFFLGGLTILGIAASAAGA